MSGPLKRRLPGSEPDAAAVERVWQRVNERSERRSYALVLAFAAGAAGVALFFVLRPSPCDDALCTTSGEPAQLAIRGDASAQQREIVLVDRSTLVLTPHTVARITTNEPTILELELNTGKVALHVEPNGPRRWGINAGEVRVEVIGTRFSVERAATFVRVEVSEGVVQVSGSTVKGGVQRLRAGEIFDTTPPALAPVLPTTLPSDPKKAVLPLAPKPPPNALPVAAPRRDDPPAETWRSLASKGRFDEASALLGTSGLAREALTANAAELILLADIAAHRGEAAESERLLARVATVTATSAEHAIAEYKRGVRFLDRGAARQAAECLERAITLGLPQGLEASAFTRVVEAWRIAGDADKARAWRERKPK